MAEGSSRGEVDPSASPDGLGQPDDALPLDPRLGRRLAVVGVVAGVLWVFGLGSVVALACGAVARAQLRDDETAWKHRRLAWAAIVLGVVGVVGGFLMTIA